MQHQSYFFFPKVFFAFLAVSFFLGSSALRFVAKVVGRTLKKLSKRP